MIRDLYVFWMTTDGVTLSYLGLLGLALFSAGGLIGMGMRRK
jgi:hypothetical protein